MHIKTCITSASERGSSLHGLSQMEHYFGQRNITRFYFLPQDASQTILITYTCLTNARKEKAEHLGNFNRMSGREIPPFKTEYRTVLVK